MPACVQVPRGVGRFPCRGALAFATARQTTTRKNYAVSAGMNRRGEFTGERAEMGCCGRVGGRVAAHIRHGEQLQRAGDGVGGGVGGCGVEGEHRHGGFLLIHDGGQQPQPAQRGSARSRPGRHGGAARVSSARCAPNGLGCVAYVKARIFPAVIVARPNNHRPKPQDTAVPFPRAKLKITMNAGALSIIPPPTTYVLPQKTALSPIISCVWARRKALFWALILLSRTALTPECISSR